MIAHLVSGVVLRKVNEPLIFSVHVSKSLWKRSWTIKRLLGEKVIWIEEHTKIQGTFNILLQLVETQRLASKCQYSLFQVEVEDDPVEISITRSPVKRRPRLGDQNNVKATYEVSIIEILRYSTYSLALS